MASAKKRKYAEQPSDGIDCPICMERYESIKILSCKHEICSKCLDQLISRGNLLCPECRRAFNKGSDFKTKKSWSLECFSCLEIKPSKEFNWCVECARLICCLCLVRQHKFSNHTIQEWDSGIPVMASLKNIHLQAENYPRQQRLLEKRMSKLFKPIFKSISKSIVESRDEEATNLLQAFSFDPKNVKNVTSNANSQATLRIAAKTSGVNVGDFFNVPVSFENSSTIIDRVRSLMIFGPEPNFFDCENNSETRESALCHSPTSGRDAPFKIKADGYIKLIRISLKRKKIVLCHFDSEVVIYDLDIFDGHRSMSEPPKPCRGIKVPSETLERGWTLDGLFDPAWNGFFLLKRIGQKYENNFHLSVIDLALMKRTCLWRSSLHQAQVRSMSTQLPNEECELTCSRSGAVFVLIRRFYNYERTYIYTTRRNGRGEPNQVVPTFNEECFLYSPLCYEIGSDTYLLAYNNYIYQPFLYRYDGSKMTWFRRIDNHPVFPDPWSRFERTVEFENHFFRTSSNAETLKVFSRDDHDFKASWEFVRHGSEIEDIAVDENRVLIAFCIDGNKFAQFEWFPLDELKKNSVLKN